MGAHLNVLTVLSLKPAGRDVNTCVACDTSCLLKLFQVTADALQPRLFKTLSIADIGCKAQHSTTWHNLLESVHWDGTLHTNAPSNVT